VDRQQEGLPGVERAGEAAANERPLLETVVRQPGDARSHERLGTFYVQTGRPFEGLWELEEARALAPNNLATCLGLADGLRAGRFPDLALAELTELLARHPGHLLVCRRLADLYLATGRPQSAVAALRCAKGLQRSPEALLALGRACQSLKQYVEAERAFKEAQRLVPGTPQPLYQLGSLYLDRGDTGHAKQTFLAAQRLIPFRPEPRYGTGLTYLHRAGPGDLARAEKEFRSAVQLDPQYAAA